MNQAELTLKLKTLPAEINKVLNDVAIITGKQAVDLFKENFQNEGFNGKPWQEVKRRQNPKTRGAAVSRKILTGDTGDLGESIKYKYLGNAEVSVYSNSPYAQAHNEGTRTAGRGNSTVIPKRQFMGRSPELDKIVETEIKKKLDNLFK